LSNPTVVPFQDGARVEVGDAEIIKLEDSIKDVFLLTLFEIMVETPRMTATEVLKRSQEKSMLLTPLVASLSLTVLGLISYLPL
jgi:protein gp37